MSPVRGTMLSRNFTLFDCGSATQDGAADRPREFGSRPHGRRLGLCRRSHKLYLRFVAILGSGQGRRPMEEKRKYQRTEIDEPAYVSAEGSVMSCIGAEHFARGRCHRCREPGLCAVPLSPGDGQRLLGAGMPDCLDPAKTDRCDFCCCATETCWIMWPRRVPRRHRPARCWKVVDAASRRDWRRSAIFDEFLVDPAPAVVPSPHLPEHQPTGDRSPRNENSPEVPNLGPGRFGAHVWDLKMVTVRSHA